MPSSLFLSWFTIITQAINTGAFKAIDFTLLEHFCLSDSRMPCICDLWSLFLSSRPQSHSSPSLIFRLSLSLSPVHHHSCDLSHPQISLRPPGQTASSRSSHFPSSAALSEHWAFSLTAGSHAALRAHLQEPSVAATSCWSRRFKMLLQNKCVVNSPKACCYLKKGLEALTFSYNALHSSHTPAFHPTPAFKLGRPALSASWYLQYLSTWQKLTALFFCKAFSTDAGPLEQRLLLWQTSPETIAWWQKWSSFQWFNCCVLGFFPFTYPELIIYFALCSCTQLCYRDKLWYL